MTSAYSFPLRDTSRGSATANAVVGGPASGDLLPVARRQVLQPGARFPIVGERAQEARGEGDLQAGPGVRLASYRGGIAAVTGNQNGVLP